MFLWYTQYMKRWLLYAPYGVLLCCLYGSVFVWAAVRADARSTDAVLTVAFLDVGQGDAIFIEAPNGHQVLIDGGKGSAVLEGLGSTMPLSDRSIDVVIATHPDLDHIGGLPGVFERYDVGMFLEPGVEDDGSDYQALHHAVREEGLTPQYVRAGMVLMLDKDIYLRILFPDRDVSTVEANTGSVVLELVYGETEFLLTGDSPQTIEEHLVDLGAMRGSDVLKLGHHGSKTSSSAQFLTAVHPQYGVVSAGCDNQYGHPHQEVLDRATAVGIELLSTCTEGTIVFQSDGNTVERK